MLKTNAWTSWTENEKEKAFDFAEEYRRFISVNKTERKFLEASVNMAEKQGFKEISKFNKLSYGDRIYKINKGKQAIFGVIGKEPLELGARFIVAHIDAPRLDLKPSPVYEDEGIAFFKTYYYGGIKKYQWLTIPLALYGIVVLKNGDKINIEIGDNPGDPVFTITDLLPHLSKDQLKKPIEEGFPGESLNVLAATIPLKKDKEPVKANLLRLFKEKYGISEEDLISSEFEMVPAGEAKDLGIDKSLILGYGQDDRVCSYACLRALVDIGKPQKSIFCVLVDQEEIGSYGSTSAQSTFFQFFLEEIAEKTDYRRNIRYIYENSKALSADVSSLFDPGYKEAYDPKNTARIGHGVCVERTTGGRGKAGSTEPPAEYIAWIRKIFDENKIHWQPAEIGKVEQGGGGTVATFLARLNIPTIDCGTGVISMHAPFEVTSKADIYSTYLAYATFYNA
ncbi:MAG: aminopeptidase [Candidatus Omnitrophica bacterium]|nr:aminopeptidase [Candidatus Omnitrophota bacterium]MCM8817580.1 aminopeptidase [Candidatus Omnitrophota bacterium]